MSDEIRFDGQAALVTGGGRGLRTSYARLLAGRGASVVVHDAGVDPDGGGGDRDVADAVTAAINASGGTAVACYENLETEAGCAAAVDLALERFGRLDSGKVLEAGGGAFDVARWVSSEEVDLGREPVAPELIAERWREIEGVMQPA